MSVIELCEPATRTVRVGSDAARVPGPIGTSEWETMAIVDRDERITLYYQDVEQELVPEAEIEVHGAIHIPVHEASRDQLRVLDASLHQVPLPHLRLLLERKPEGFLCRGSAGRAGSMRFTGGLNASADYSDSPDHDERRLIIITYGAFWEYRHLRVCPTVLHEIGHVMTHRGEISYARFPEERALLMRGTRASRNPGAEEALCNAYMYFLCYGSEYDEVRSFGSGHDNQNDAIARAGLRACRAFRRPLCDEAWQARLGER